MRNAGLLATLFFVLIGSTIAQAAIDVRIDKRTQSMEVTVDGVPRFSWPVSTGRAGYATPSGSFRGTRLEEVYYSKKYDNAPMPHAVFFTNNGHAIHGTNETRRLGSAVSHGCVRLAPKNAATLFRLVQAEGLASLRVTIVGNAPTAKKQRPAPARPTPDWSGQPEQWPQPDYYPSPWNDMSDGYYSDGPEGDGAWDVW